MHAYIARMRTEHFSACIQSLFLLYFWYYHVAKPLQDFRQDRQKIRQSGTKSISAFPTYSLNRDRSFETTYIIAKMCSNHFPAFSEKIRLPSSYAAELFGQFLATLVYVMFTVV
jgi:hypothetical protein